MKQIILVLMMTLGFTTVSLMAQKDVNPVTDPKIVVEARYFGEGMSGIVGEHLIARIYSDRKIEYEDIGKGNRYKIKQSRISRGNFEKLIKLLSDKNIENISDNYSAIYPTIDHTEDLKLKISVNGKIREISIENFKPNLPKTKTIYPKQLVDIVCLLETLRKSAEIKFFFREVSDCKG